MFYVCNSWLKRWEVILSSGSIDLGRDATPGRADSWLACEWPGAEHASLLCALGRGAVFTLLLSLNLSAPTCFFPN